MAKKYQTYLAFIKPKEATMKHKESFCSHSNSNVEVETVPQKGFINRSTIELIFPGHINSYYASAEF